MTTNALVAHREALGLSRMHVAEVLGVDSSTIWRWEHSRIMPTLQHFRTLATLYQVSLSTVISAFTTVSAERHDSVSKEE